MNGVVKKKKKAMLLKIIAKNKRNSSPHEQEYITSGVPLNDIRIEIKDIVAIASRRKELKAAKHSFDAMVTFESGNV